MSVFNKIPKSALWALLIIITLETSSWGMIKIFTRNMSGVGNVAGGDPDFFYRSFRKYSQDKSFYNQYPVIQFASLEDMGKRGPYDVIVFGTSVANMGWVEVMRQDLGVRACNTWPLLNQFAYKSAGTVILDNYDKINDHRRAILVYGDFFEWYNLGLSALEDNQISASSVSYNKEIVTPLVKVVRRAIHWLRVRISPQVIVCNINGDDELFFASDLRSLSEKKEFSPENYADLVKKLIHFKDRAEKIDCRFVIVAFPSKAQQYEWLLRETGNIQGVSPRASSRTLRKAAAECGIPFLDLEEKLTPIAKEVYAKERRLLWWRDDTHMNGLGVKYVAAIVKEFIDTLDKQN